jgi:hypothetical protein
MSVTISGDGTITGLSAGGLPDGTVTAADLASTLDLTGKTVTLPAGVGGKVLQVVMGTFSTPVITSSTSYVDTGLSATITPSSASSKVLVFANVPDAHNNSQLSLIHLNIVRAGTQIIEFVKHGDYVGSSASLVTYGGSTSYLDSPNTTSSTTYKVQFKVGGTGAQYVFLNSSTGTIVLMEIAA